MFQVIEAPSLETGSGSLQAMSNRGEAGNFDFRRSGFKNPKDLNVWAIVRMGRMRLDDRDLEAFEKIMNSTAREYGMNLDRCGDKGTNISYKKKLF